MRVGVTPRERAALDRAEVALAALSAAERAYVEVLNTIEAPGEPWSPPTRDEDRALVAAALTEDAARARYLDACVVLHELVRGAA